MIIVVFQQILVKLGMCVIVKLNYVISNLSDACLQILFCVIKFENIFETET